MKLFIYPNIDLWEYAIRGLEGRDDVKCLPLNPLCSKLQMVCRKLFPEKKLPASFILGGELRRALKKLKQGDTVLTADYTEPCLMNAISSSVRDGVNKRLWLWNPMKDNGRFERLLPIIRDIGFEVHTFDSKDAEKYGLVLNEQFFPIKYNEGFIQPEIEHDFYFAGFKKDRGQIIENTKKLLSKYRLRFHVVTKTAECIPYSENIEVIKRTKCLVEIVQGQQSGLTLRPLEAFTFGKKLVTNNNNITKYPFYKPENIFIMGVDPIERLDEFLNAQFVPVNDDIKKRYDINTWIDNI